MDTVGFIKEVFLSFQGEGYRIGEPCVFVRLADCNLQCPWCDTEYDRTGDFEIDLPGFHQRLSNPVDAGRLAGIISAQVPDGLTLSITGGEPLLQNHFCSALAQHYRILAGTNKAEARKQAVGHVKDASDALDGRDLSGKKIKNDVRIMLETNGTLPEQLEPVIDAFDYVSMDVKIDPPESWEAYSQLHRRFLALLSGRAGCAKIVVGERSDRRIFAEALNMVAEMSMNMVVQPVTGGDGRISEEDFAAAHNLALMAAAVHNPVRLIPQMHRLIGMR